MSNAGDELLDLFQLLNEDVATCGAAIQQERDTNIVDMFWRRAYVRSVFAFIEGVIYRMKLLAFEDSQYASVNFSSAELAFLIEEDFDVDDHGEIVSKPAKISLTRNLKFAFKAIARANGIGYKLRVDDNRWALFRQAVRVRDRLMHPKQVADLVVPNEELDQVIHAWGWFTENFNACFILIRAALQQRLDDQQKP